MNRDFLLINIFNLSLPRLQFYASGLYGAINADAQGQGVLVLVRQRDQVLVAKHGKSLNDKGREASNFRHLRVPRGLFLGVVVGYSTLLAAREKPASAGRSVSQSVRMRSHSWMSRP